MVSGNEKISLEAAGMLVSLHKQKGGNVAAAGQLTDYFTNSSLQIQEIFRELSLGGYVKEVLF